MLPAVKILFIAKKTKSENMKQVVCFRIRRHTGERCFSIRVKRHVTRLLSNVRRVPFKALITLSALLWPLEQVDVTSMWVVAEDTLHVP
jgi:hypothetical protein